MSSRIETNMQIDIRHITRVEGHGNIVVDVQNGELKTCELQVVETPRFIEAMLRGRPYDQAALITSRICGICSVGHAITSLQTVEDALGIKISEQTRILRMMTFLGEIIDSHVLHAYMLVAPDCLGVGSVIPLAKSAPDVVMRALRMKKFAGDLCAALCGRHTQPISMIPGGFAAFPSTEQIEGLRARLETMRTDLQLTVELFQTLRLPAFERPTEYMALVSPGEYAWLDGEIASSDGGRWPLSAYRQVTNETLVRHSTAKRTHNQRSSFMVGALARFNLNAEYLLPPAQAAAQALGLKPPCHNPYLITVAQVVELVQAVEQLVLLSEALLEQGIVEETPAAPRRLSGEGFGSTEVPRGILFHNYRIEEGRLSAANCIIPTNQNLQNIEDDMRALVPTLLDQPQEKVGLALEMLVRAYDPCISCSTHLLDVRFE